MHHPPFRPSRFRSFLRFRSGTNGAPRRAHFNEELIMNTSSKNVSAPRKDSLLHTVEGYKVFDSLAYARSHLQSVQQTSAFLRATTFLSHFITAVFEFTTPEVVESNRNHLSWYKLIESPFKACGKERGLGGKKTTLRK